MTLIIPVLAIALWSLHIIKLPQSKLYAISLLLFMGFVTISLAIARAILYDVHIRKETPLDQSVDIIGLVEPLVASWLACLPALRVLLRFRRRSRPEELTERIHELRGSGHARITSGRDDDTTQIGRAFGGEDMESGGNCGHTSFRKDLRSPASSKFTGIINSANLSPIGARVSSRSSDDDDVGKENVNSVRLNSFTGSDGSTQIGEWRSDVQQEVDAEDKGFSPLGTYHRQRAMTAESTTPLSPRPIFDSEKLRNAYSQRAKAYANPNSASPITTLSRNTTNASRKEGRDRLSSSPVQEENEDTPGERRISARNGGEGVVMI